jgi:hypothetical protein
MNPLWISILQHTLGLDSYGQPPKGRVPCSDDDFPNCYRNNYCIGPECREWQTLCDLVVAGLMVDAGAKNALGGMHVFHATLAGYEAVRRHSPRPPKQTKAQRRWSHYRDVREVCPDLTFGQYLKAPWRKESEERAGIYA